MALTNEELQDIISNLSPEERKQLLSQLGRQVEVDNITNPTQSTNTKPKVKPKSDNSKVYCCPLCGSASYKKHGTTTSGMQRYICKDCGKTFSENYGDSLRYTHLSESQWLNILNIIAICPTPQSQLFACRQLYGKLLPEVKIDRKNNYPDVAGVFDITRRGQVYYISNWKDIVTGKISNTNTLAIINKIILKEMRSEMSLEFTSEDSLKINNIIMTHI